MAVLATALLAIAACSPKPPEAPKSGSDTSEVTPATTASKATDAGPSDAADGARPPALKALEAQGLKIMDEFPVGGGLRAFAAVAGSRPLAVYVTTDGHAIVGTRLDGKGEQVDEDALTRLAAKPISDQEWAELEAAHSVRDGRADAPRVVYTFSDPNCPYCHRFWAAARPWVDAGKVQLRHIMVGIIREDSPTKAAAILGATDPSAALLENEHKFSQGGITPLASVPDDLRKTLDEGQRLMLSMGFNGTPGIVVRGPDGILKKSNGMPQGPQLEEVLGPR